MLDNTKVLIDGLSGAQTANFMVESGEKATIAAEGTTFTGAIEKYINGTWAAIAPAMTLANASNYHVIEGPGMYRYNMASGTTVTVTLDK